MPERAAPREDIRRTYTRVLKLTRGQFAKRTGIEPRTITNIVNGAPVSEAKAALIAEVLGWTVDEVLEGKQSTEGPKPTGPGRPSKDGSQPVNPTGPRTPKRARSRARSAA